MFVDLQNVFWLYWSTTSSLQLLLVPPHPVFLPNLCVHFLLLSLITQVQSVLSICAWIWDHPLECGNLLAPTNPKDSYSPSFSSQLSIAPQLGWGLRRPSPIHAGIVTALILCRSCAGNHSSCNLMYATPTSCPDISISQLSSPSAGSYILSASSFMMFSEPWFGIFNHKSNSGQAIVRQ